MEHNIEIEEIMKKSKYNAFEEFVRAVLLDIVKIGSNATANKYGISSEEVEKINSTYVISYFEEPISNEILNNIKELSNEVTLKEKDSEYEKYSKLYQERFGRKVFISNPGGSKEQTIEAIKISLEKNEDLLGELLNPSVEGNLY